MIVTASPWKLISWVTLLSGDRSLMACSLNDGCVPVSMYSYVCNHLLNKININHFIIRCLKV